MVKIKLRYQRISDAQRFYDILTNPNFKYLRTPLKSVNDEVNYLKQAVVKRKKNFEYNYSIIYDNKLVGACSIKINQHRPFIGEFGYFVDEKYWGLGIATAAVKKLEKISFKKLKLKRLEILMQPENKRSEQVAIKSGYKKEALMKKAVKMANRYYDTLLYAKVR